MDWKFKPTVINSLPPDTSVTHMLFMDENGDASMKYVTKQFFEGKPIDKNSSFFTLTGALISKDSLSEVSDLFKEIKDKYWDNGMFDYGGKVKRVCFHSHEIRNKTGPFSLNMINFESFMIDLTNLIESIEMTVFSSTIDKEKLFLRYNFNSFPPYNLSLTFIFERLVQSLNGNDEVIVILESRGRKEDKIILEHILNVLEVGTQYVDRSKFTKIVGVYFNGKRPSNRSDVSYFGLEIADLCSHPIHRSWINKASTRPFASISKKVYGYPGIRGKGIKKFP